jgi:hypothetical protein
MKQLLAICLSCLLLSSCKEGWTDEYKEAYLSTCMEEARRSTFPDSAKAAAYCQCSMESLMAHYQTIEELLINRDSLAVRDEFQACHDKVTAQ